MGQKHIYLESKLLGAVYFEFPAPRGDQLVEKRREGGELFLWIGPFHFILTPKGRLVRAKRKSDRIALAAMTVWFANGATAGMALALAGGVAAAVLPVEVEATDPMGMRKEAIEAWDEIQIYQEASVLEALATSLMSQ